MNNITARRSSFIIPTIATALETVDLLVTTGCSGDKDCLKNILKENFKAKLHFGIFFFLLIFLFLFYYNITVARKHMLFDTSYFLENVCIKPGKSTVFASSNVNGKTKYILCLPANPVSVFVTAYLFLLPLINYMHNISYVKPTKMLAEVRTVLIHHENICNVYAYFNGIIYNVVDKARIGIAFTSTIRIRDYIVEQERCHRTN